VHCSSEWTPTKVGSTWEFPSRQEAEYSAVLALAMVISASWWALRMGLAKFSLETLHMPEAIPTGDRIRRLDLDPSFHRQQSMARWEALSQAASSLERSVVLAIAPRRN
jgi:hypothetical protein